MLLYFAVVMLLVLVALLSQRACPGRWEFEAVVTEEHLTVGRPESRDGPDIQVPLSHVTDVYLDMTNAAGPTPYRQRFGKPRAAAARP